MKPDYSNVEVGDYMLKDGTTVSPDEMTEEQESQAIGVVAYLYEEDQNIFLKGGVKATLKAKEVEKPHGLVIALKNAGKEKYEWSTEDYPTAKRHTTLKEQIYNGSDGLEKTNNLTTIIEDFPAFKVAKEYEQEVPAPKNTTGWYLPSIGEWFRMLDNYKEFSQYISQGMGCWSSSGYCTDYAYYVGFYSDGGFYYYFYRRNNTNYVRPVLAF